MKTINEAIKIWTAFSKEVVPIEPEKNNIDFSNLVGSIYCPGPWYSYIFAINEGRFVNMHPNAKLFYGKEKEDVILDDLINRIHPDDHKFFLQCEETIANFLTQMIDPNTIFKYKMVYSFRFRDITGKYRLLLHQCIAFARGPQGNMVASMGVHTFIDHLISENNYKLSIIGLDGFPSYLGMNIIDTQHPIVQLKHNFSNREILIIRKLSEGLSSKDIAKDLYVSIDTVRTHRQNILEKSKCHNTSELIAKCYQQGIL